VAWQYLELGVAHILLGFDHLLFVLALLLIVRGWRRLLATVTAFTVAHSITLATATLGFVRVTFTHAYFNLDRRGEKLLQAPVGEWFGPVASAYGLHLVRVLERSEPRIPEFDELRDRLSTVLQHHSLARLHLLRGGQRGRAGGAG
jgi:hypothetical protein